MRPDEQDIEWLLENQKALDARLERIEQSLIFRTLRRIGRLTSRRPKASAEPAPITPTPPPSAEFVSIVICTRTATLLEACLTALESRTAHQNCEVIVVQHGGDSTLTQVIAAHKAKRVPYPGPFNFADMNNQGAAAATGTILLFLNDDVTPLKPDWLTRIIHHLADPTIGAVGAKLTFPDGTLQHAGIAAFGTAGAWHPGRACPPNALWPAITRQVSAVTGACLALRAQDFRHLGGFDPAFPINFNDVDLCFRLEARGLRILIDIEAELQHDESRTRAPGSTYDERRLFFRKWSQRLMQPDPYYAPNLAQNTEEILLR